MTRPHRIAGGGIIVRDERILLVRYPNPDGTTFLVGPGGGALEGESVAEAAVRETLEETGLIVAPRQVLLIEDILASRFKMCKVWLACDIVGGEVTPTDGARLEGIIEAGWFMRDALEGETVYPWIVKERPWRSFHAPGYVTEISPPRSANF